ncbi:hypothetical protein ONZ45_g10618 [Pleurotus djamor]|nr:hypothetical protein ONZ45_g10618 [Pleurotus djamor]
MSAKFPTEIFSVILTDLGTPDRRVLTPLLVVNRQFYELVIPLLYETITLLPTLIDGTVYPRPPETAITYTQFHKFFTAISRNRSLAARIVTFITSDSRRSHQESTGLVKEAITYLTHPKRLDVSDDFVVEDPANVLSPSVSLTHLAFHGRLTEAVYELIRSQPTLQYISLQHSASTDAISALPPIALPHLISLDCREDFLLKLQTSSPPPIQNLSLMLTHASLLPSQIIRNARTLCLWCPNYEQVTPWFEHVECLHIASVDINVILSIPSRDLRYLRFEVKDILWKDVTRLFAAFPALKVVDIDVQALFIGLDDTSYRVVRGSRKYRQIRIPPTREFDHWHEVCMDHVEYI